MPTPVSSARQCLTPDAANALDEAVSVARRRSHAQTTSLHAISALLSLSSSPLREACGRARNTAYTSRIQFKALELCLGVSLDRLPSSPQRVEEPPVSNSLMAAIKRSQANQRRQPENFQMYHQQRETTTSPSSSVSTVKVELRNLILSILDDPVVSRVLGEAGFRSCEIKLAVLRPVHQFLRYKGPPVFLCNLSDDSFSGRRGFTFPFQGFSESDENCKRIGEILVGRNRKKNPMIVGVSAIDALKNFLEMVQGRNNNMNFNVNVNVLPAELCGVGVICIGSEVLNFVSGNFDDGLLKLKLEEVEKTVKQGTGPGLILNFGDFKVLIGENVSMEKSSYVVGELGRLVEVYGGKLWVIGATARYETYLELLKKFPNIEKDWDLQVLNLASPRFPSMAESFPKSSLMDSFVPFGGFFSTPSDIKIPLSASTNYIARCHLCNEKCKQEVKAISGGGFTASVSDQYQSSLPSWLRMSEPSTNRELDASKAKDDSVLLSAKVVGLEKKWDHICQRLHQSQPYSHILTKAAYKVGPQVPVIVGFQVAEGGKKENMSAGHSNSSSLESGCVDVKSSSKSMDVSTNPINLKLPPKFGEKICRSSLSSSSIGDDLASPMSANSVTTDLGLGVNSASSCPVYHGRLGQNDFKMIYASLSTRVGRQEEAVAVVSETIARYRARNDKRRGDIWFSFIGPDVIAKKKIAFGLAEVLYGDKEKNIISLDLNFQDPTRLRGKNIIDLIADELQKKPLSVVFLENIDTADLLTQNHLSQAVKTGKFQDSHGREVSISNAIFVTTLSFSDENKTVTYSEENILKAKGLPFQMSAGSDLACRFVNQKPKVLHVTSRKQTPKRKLFGMSEETTEIYQIQNSDTVKRAHLDLNLPAEENETHYDSEVSERWLEDFLKQVDEKVMFKPFDFDSLAEKILDEISNCFRKMVGSESLLEIDSKVMEQILAASCLLESSAVENWIEQVLSSAFAEARGKHSLSFHSVVKLIACESQFQEEQMQSPGNLLPAKIIIN